MSWLGVLAGMGDVMAEETRKREEQTRAEREGFIQQLTKIAESEDWPEQARAAAWQARIQALNPKTKSKDYEKLWGGILHASRRPAQESVERNAQRSQVPALQSLAAKQQPLAAPRSAGMGNIERPGGDEEAANAIGVLDLLRPSPTDGAPGLNAPSGFLGLRPAAAQEGTLTGPMQSTAGGAYSRLAQEYNAPNTQQTVGPYTRGEKSQQAAEQLRQQIAAFNGYGGNQDNLVVKPNMVGGKPGFYTQIRNQQPRQATYLDANGQAQVGYVSIDSTGNAFDGNGSPVQVLRLESPNRPVGIRTVQNGQPVTAFEDSLDLSGNAYPYPVQTQIQRSTGENGEQFATAFQPGFNGRAPIPISRMQIGSMPFGHLIGQTHKLNNQQKELLIKLAPYMQSELVEDIDGGQIRVFPRAQAGVDAGFLDPNTPTFGEVGGGGIQLSGERLKAFQTMRTGMEQLAAAWELAETAAKNYGGIAGLAGRWSKFEQGLIEVSPAERNLFTKLEQFFNQYRVAITGAQAGMEELRMLRAVTPDITNPNMMLDIQSRLEEMMMMHQLMTGKEWQRQGIPVLTGVPKVKPRTPRAPGTNPRVRDVPGVQPDNGGAKDYDSMSDEDFVNEILRQMRTP